MCPSLRTPTRQRGMYVLTRMDFGRSRRWLGSWKSFSGQWIRSVHGHAHGCWWRHCRQISDALCRLWRLRWGDPYDRGCNDWRNASNCVHLLPERQKNLRPSTLSVSAHERPGIWPNPGRCCSLQRPETTLCRKGPQSESTSWNLSSWNWWEKRK